MIVCIIVFLAMWLFTFFDYYSSLHFFKNRFTHSETLIQARNVTGILYSVSLVPYFVLQVTYLFQPVSK